MSCDKYHFLSSEHRPELHSMGDPRIAWSAAGGGEPLVHSWRQTQKQARASDSVVCETSTEDR